MGYRTYIASIPKREYNKIKGMARIQLHEFYRSKLDENEPYLYPNNFTNREYEFGSFYPSNIPKGSMKDFFINKELKEHYLDYDLKIVTKEFLASIIEWQSQKVKRLYEPIMAMADFRSEAFNKPYDAWTEEEKKAFKYGMEILHSNSLEWFYLKPFDLEDGNDSITNSWKFEYSIFELVRIYKHFDWKKKVMCFYGY